MPSEVKDSLLKAYLRYIAEGRRSLAKIGLKDSSLRVLPEAA